ncbi:MAG TPA: exodeoxyribonuclease VII small subunit [Candidatus Omnitrophica bacterium]|nr:exodeoxyribonuclease VII small subunit [Candidatus Omnitrophota bacterium]
MAEIKFEDALKRMEKLVAELEDGKLTLEEAVKKYEEGIKLSLVCSKTLDSAKRKVEVLMKKDGVSGNARFEVKDFDNNNKND